MELLAVAEVEPVEEVLRQAQVAAAAVVAGEGAQGQALVVATVDQASACLALTTALRLG